MKLLEDDAPTHSLNLLDKSMGLDAHQVQESLDHLKASRLLRDDSFSPARAALHWSMF